MDQSTVLWIAVVVAAFVFLDVLFVELRRCGRELATIARRLAAYGELPILSLAAAAASDVERLAADAARVPALLVRARAALAALRIIRGPLLR